MAPSPHVRDLTRLEEAHLVQEIKSQILGNIRALFGPYYRSNHGFDIVTYRRMCSRRPGSKDEYIIPQAIVYLAPNNGKWELLMEACSGGLGIVCALQEFLKDVERKRGAILGRPNFGDAAPAEEEEDTSSLGESVKGVVGSIENSFMTADTAGFSLI